MKHVRIYGAILAIVGLTLIFLFKFLVDYTEVLGELGWMFELKVGLMPLIFIVIFVLGVALSTVKEKKPVEIPEPPK